MKNSFSKFLFTSLLSGGMYSLYAQPLQDAIKFTESEQFEKAANAFVSLTQQEPTNGENYFYYGENYFKGALLDSSFKAIDLDSARICYESGMKKNPGNPLNYTG